MRRSLVKILGITALAISITFTNFSVPVMAIEPTNSIIIEDSKSSNDFISNEIENNIKSETIIENNKDNLKDESNNKEEEDQLNEIKEMLKESKTENEAESEIIEQEPLQYPDIKGDVIEDGNKYPIVLVHGFLGFGRDELLGYKYWGGLVDVQESLRDQGYKTYTATVGPVSSNWDRACELYAYIVGGTVDYGEAHSKKYGHERYGRTFEGLYKDVSDANKIHLIGHSMGGQTVRTLTQLLSEGSEEEKNYNQENISPLFMGGKHWVRSVTTISTPNDGTTLSDLIPAKELISKSIGVLGSINGKDNLSNCLYDFKLDQFGLKKQPGESYISYANRVKDSNIWSETKDIGPYDLSTYGAKELNKWVKAQPDVYYFSWVTKATKKLLITGYAVPQIGPMNPAFYPSATLMGNYTRSYRGPVIDEDWFDNDGVVNSISQEGPRFGSNDVIKKFNGQPKVGQWNVMPTLINTDHMDIVGTFGDVEDWYIDYAEQLSNLPR
ncbi:lipase [Clostridium botulinum]|uniref:triacylglycerol lipase n=1 Tax=Clostridium botulinum (strain Eklund 17B / Type B) TaxID=935198 RepID=B2TQP5_CLOBB|nr:triacylglycerol lipase [Clostridium botulinum B str. Eklund 17B (NRP)]MBY6975678.1 lipase [Clostridium botulinum]MBY7001227.1 lipase [Clostridium botulinum]MCR1273994.1 lipase [Clostridium botulinum]NFD69242.1 lipase [Clostridium botulinum]